MHQVKYLCHLQDFLCHVYTLLKEHFSQTYVFGKSSTETLEFWLMKYPGLVLFYKNQNQSLKHFLKKCPISKVFGQLLL